MGLGTSRLQTLREDGPTLANDALAQNVQNIIGKSVKLPARRRFQLLPSNVPQLDADIDRVKAKQEGVPLENPSKRCKSTWLALS